VVIDGTDVQLDDDLTVGGDLTINSGKKLTIQDDVDVTVSGTLTNNGDETSLVIESSSNGTGSLIHTSSGVDATVQRYFTTGDWHLIGLPIVAPTAGIFYDMYLYYWDEEEWDNATTGGWYNYTNVNQSLTDATYGNYFKGYYVKDANVGTTTLSFEGELVNTDLTATNLSYTTSGANTYRGFHLIGNPYTAPIDLEDFFANSNNNMSNTVYQRSGVNTHDYYQQGGTGSSAGATQYIPTGQAFWVQVTSATNSVNLDRGDRDYSSKPAFRKKEEMTRVYLRVTNQNKHFDEVAIVFSRHGGNGYDPIWDATKMFADNPDVPQIYSYIHNSGPLCINHFSEAKMYEVEKTDIKVNLIEGENEISTVLENIPGNMGLFLKIYKPEILQICIQITINLLLKKEKPHAILYFILCLKHNLRIQPTSIIQKTKKKILQL
jgi:hypothetical protein